MKKRERKRPKAEINVVPYIDVMLVLLIIFMVTTPLLAQGVKVDLPKATAQAIKQEQAPLIVSVDAHGNYYLNTNSDPDAIMTAPALVSAVTEQLTRAQQTGTERQILVKGDQQVDYGKVMQVMVLLQKAGAQGVGLVTQDPATAT